ncbi:MAG: sodium:solute symporter, partial [Bacteroidota bacterium]
LLGLYAFGLFTKKSADDSRVPIVCLLSPVICYFLNEYSAQWMGGYKFGFELLILNGLITFFGLHLISKAKLSRPSI